MIITHHLTAWDIPPTPVGLATHLRAHPAPDVKPQGAQNDPLLVHMCRLVGPAAAHPALEDVAACTGLALDLDGPAGSAIADVAAAIAATGVGGVLSESHSGPGAYHFRAWYDREVTPEAHRAIWRAYMSAVAPMGPMVCHNPNRGFNAPRASAQIWLIDGAPLDTAMWLSRAPVAGAPAPVVDECPALLTASRDAWRDYALEWLGRQAPAVEGRGGDLQTFRVAVGLVRGWLLSPGVALACLADWNAMCQPPWASEDLQRKLSVAAVESTAPWGYLLPQRPGSIDQALVPGDMAVPVAVPTPVAAGAPSPPTRDPDVWLADMNARHAVLTQIGGKCKVLSWDYGDLGAVPVLQSFDDIKNRYMHVRVPVGLDETMPLGHWWLSQPARREALSLKFAPLAGPIVDGCINTWTGYGCAPAAGAWPRMQALIGDIIASGDAVSAAYITRWIAWVLQHPGDRAEVVLVLRGAKGTGKNTLLDAVCSLLGPHALTVSSPRHLTGNFNAHLHACALLFANEAIPPNDKAAESVLKALVTDGTLAVERKGVDVEQRRNSLSVCMASNEQWCVPAGLDERRFAVFDVSRARLQDHDYFEAIRAELDGGGRAAMLHALLSLDLGAWHPRRDVPRTAALVDQQLDGLRGADRAVYQMLAAGELTGAVRVATAGPAGCVFVATRVMNHALGQDPTKDRGLAMALRKCVRPEHAGGTRQSGQGLDGHARRAGFWMPPLAEARALWVASTGVNVTWDDADGWAGV